MVLPDVLVNRNRENGPNDGNTISQFEIKYLFTDIKIYLQGNDPQPSEEGHWSSIEDLYVNEPQGKILVPDTSPSAVRPEIRHCVNASVPDVAMESFDSMEDVEEDTISSFMNTGELR